MTTTARNGSKPQILEVGWGVAIILRQPINGLACYVGQVQAVDDRGVRISLMNWLIGECVGFDWLTPWDNIAAMEIATDAHSGWDPGWTQTKANHAAGLMTDEEFAAARRER
jgi:hypothetical protein